MSEVDIRKKQDFDIFQHNERLKVYQMLSGYKNEYEFLRGCHPEDFFACGMRVIWDLLDKNPTADELRQYLTKALAPQNNKFQKAMEEMAINGEAKIHIGPEDIQENK